MNQPKIIDPVLEELVREIARAPHSRILRTRVHEPGPPPEPSQAERELLRVYRTQAAELWCDAALDCLMKSKVGTEVLFHARNVPRIPVTPDRISREGTLLDKSSPYVGSIQLLSTIYKNVANIPFIPIHTTYELARTSSRLVPSVRACLICADAYYQENKLARAQAMCAIGLRIAYQAQDRAQLHERLGVYARRNKKPEQYLAHSLRATAADSQNAAVLWNLVRASLEVGSELYAIQGSNLLDRLLDSNSAMARRLMDGILQRKAARGRVADFALREDFHWIRVRLASSTRGLIDAFA